MDRKAALFIAMGTECVAVIVVFIFIGNWVDERFGWKGLGGAAGAVIGFIVWFSHLLMVIRELAKKNEMSQKSEK